VTPDLLFQLKALLLGVVEGLTEFIPISSTAHLLILGRWLSFSSGDAKVFEVVIQFGSILAVIWLFRARLWQLLRGVLTGQRQEVLFCRNLLIAFLPAVVVGVAVIGFIKTLYGWPWVFVVTLSAGGVLMLWVERRPRHGQTGGGQNSDGKTVTNQRATAHALEQISWKQALAVGCAQCLAMVPGTSRSGATIIGGMLAGIERKTATEFSFFLAMPTMLAATVYDLYKHGASLSFEQTQAIALGFVAAFFSALFIVRTVLRFVSRHTYRPFAWYRIGLAAVLAGWLMVG